MIRVRVRAVISSALSSRGGCAHCSVHTLQSSSDGREAPAGPAGIRRSFSEEASTYTVVKQRPRRGSYYYGRHNYRSVVPSREVLHLSCDQAATEAKLLVLEMGS